MPLDFIKNLSLISFDKKTINLFVIKTDNININSASAVVASSS